MRGAPYAKLEPVNVRKGQEMALTEYEKKVLEQMEASLREEDPALASQMSAPAPAEETESEPQRGPRAPRRIALWAWYSSSWPCRWATPSCRF